MLSYGPSASNNGNVLSQTITGPGLSGTASQSYTYDSLNRLKTMAEAGGCAQLYSYDRYGNRAVVTGTGYCVPSTTYTPNLPADDPAQVEQIFPNNRWTGATHNLVGNQTALPGWTFAYDGENRVKTATSSLTSATYVYDGEGRRVKRTVNGAATTYVYDAMGNLAAEYGGETVAGGRVYLTTDHLGSTRLVTNASAAAVECRDYFPFGEEMTSGTRTGCYAGDVARQKFTGKERDTETGLDYFGARSFSGAQGRFTSPDPTFMTRQRISDPQQWNLYAYVRNNPLAYIDPDGRELKPVRVYFSGGNQRIGYVDARLVPRLEKFVAAARDSGLTFTFNNILRTESQQAGIKTPLQRTRQARAHISRVWLLMSTWRPVCCRAEKRACPTSGRQQRRKGQTSQP